MYLHIYFVCLSVRLNLKINAKTAGPIGPTFFVEPHMTPREGLWLVRIKNSI